ncbi:MAG: PKD domain-containing protein [Planctomycetes bacterium]|nr:PKD domain-containing protein [Planctomycetota bacterium]
MTLCATLCATLCDVLRGVRCARVVVFLALAVVAAVAAIAPDGLAATTTRGTWTTGHKKILVIPVRFTDFGGPSDVPNANGYHSEWGRFADGTTQAEIAAFVERQSYGKCTVEFTLLPEIDMGVSYTAYNATYPGLTTSKFTNWSEPGSILDDARAKARAAGIAAGNAALYDTDNYDLDIVACGFIPGQGTSSSGLTHGKGVFALNFKVLAHELCHNFGCQHANGRSGPAMHSQTKPGSYFYEPYGDVYCLMGYAPTTVDPLPPARDLNAFWKNLFGWLPDANLAAPTTSGTYRIHAFDQGSIDAGKNYAMKIRRDADRVYWYDFRQAITGTDAAWAASGLEVHFGGESIPATAGHTLLLDMTPGSRGDTTAPLYATMHDAQLQIGKTFTDPEIDLHVTPIQKGGTTPESLDVVVNFGPFAGNGAPSVSISPATVTVAANVAQTFTATASDPDGDTLAYSWEFDDWDVLGGTSYGASNGGANSDARISTQGSHTWTRSGTYIVRCTATDMKGHVKTASSTVTVTGGTAALLTISGTVKDESGNPLEGAVVNNYKASGTGAVSYGSAAFAGSSPTAADGKFIIPLPATLASPYNLTCLYRGYGFSCSWANGTVYVSTTSRSGVDFTRLRATRTVSGGVYVAGRGYDPATDGDLFVSDGTQNVAVAGGAFQMSVADGTALTLTPAASNPTYVVTSTFPKPYTVVDDFNLLHFFVDIPGGMPRIQFASAGTTSNDTVGTVQIPVEFTLPSGMTSWPADQQILYWIDRSSTAEYGVDYKMSGGRILFPRLSGAATRTIPLKILHDGVPKSRTVVVKMGPATSIASLGAVTTYTYTITNPTPPPPPPPPPPVDPKPVTPEIGTVGTIVEIRGTAFGTAKGRVEATLATAAAKHPKRLRLKVLTWTDTVIRAQIARAFPGTFDHPAACDLAVLPRFGNSQTFTSGFRFVAPTIASVSPDLAAAAWSPRQDVSLTGDAFGTVRGTVTATWVAGARVMTKSCKVLSWPSAAAEGGDGPGQVRVQLPAAFRSSATGVTLSLRNRVGTAIWPAPVPALAAK